MKTNLGYPKGHTLLSKRVNSSERTGNEWVLGFTLVSLECGQRHHALYVLDNSTRDCLAVEAGLSQSAEGIINVLDQLKLERDLPARILLYQSSEHNNTGLLN